MAVATVNRESALLRRAFSLGREATPPKVLLIPHFPLLPENNVRSGFLEHAEYQALLVELPKELRPLLVVGYRTGRRVGELLSLKWHPVDSPRTGYDWNRALQRTRTGACFPSLGTCRHLGTNSRNAINGGLSVAGYSSAMEKESRTFAILGAALVNG
jgi:integrase